MSVRLNLFLVVLAGVLPVLFVILASGWERRNHGIEDTTRDVSQIALSIAGQQEKLTHGIHQWLSALAMLPEVKTMDAVECTKMFKDFLARNPWHGGIVLIKLDGSVIASGTPFSPTANFSDMKHFKGALQNHEFSPGEFTEGRVTGLPVIPFALPVMDAQGNVICVLSTSLRVEIFQEFFDLSHLPKDSFVGLVDSSGVRVYRFPPQPDCPSGGRIPKLVWDSMQTVDKEMSFTFMANDGLERICDVRRLRLLPDESPYLNIFVGIPKSYAFARADMVTEEYLLWLGLSLLLSAFLARLVGKFGIHQPLSRLAVVAQRLGTGDLSTRTGLPKGRGSLNKLAAAIDEMAMALEMDIIQRKKAEDALQKSEERYRLIADHTSDSIWAMGPDLRFDYLSPSTERLFGYSADDLGTLDWTIFAPTQPLDNVAGVFESLRSGSAPGSVMADSLVRHKDGRETLVEFTATSVLDEEGALSRIVGVTRDVSERKEAERALAASKQDFEIIFANSQVGILLMRGKNVMARCNQRLAEILGYADPEEIMGLSARSIHFSGESFREFVERYYNRLAQGGQTQIEFPLRRKDGLPIWCSISGKAVNPADLDVGVIWVIDDMTSRKKAEEDTLKAKAVAEAANLAKSEFLANMSHELRTPLNGMLGMLQLIKTTNLNKEQHEYAEMAIQSGQRLTRLLSDILDLSRVEAGRMALQYEPFSLYETLGAVDNMFLPVVRQSGVELRHHIDSRIPDYLLGDSTRLQQVLTNLIGNAFKFTESGYVLVEAFPLPPLQPGGYRILFSVADSGSGIAEDKLCTIFSPFVQASQGFRRTHQGAGLGLSICRQLIDLMGGNISVGTELGEGTTVYFCVSLKLPQHARSALHAAAESKMPLQSGLKVLLAEDDAVSRLAAIRQLERAGCIVTSVEDGKQAVDMLSQQGFDVVLMDIQMPRMDGVDATRAIRNGEAGAGNAGIRIIALTAYTMAGDREQFLAAGMDGYLAKPVDMDELERVLAEGVRCRRSH